MTVRRSSPRLARALAASLAVAALAAPSASAMPRIDAGAGESGPPQPTPPVVVRASDDGFDWGSAAIGAGAGGGALLVLVSLGGLSYATRHRVGVSR
jgi:hypothetical protein